MRIALASLLLATTMGLGSAAYAADPPKLAPPADATAGHAKMDHAVMCMGLSDARLAAAKADLKITDAQSSQWNAFVEAEKSSAEAMRHDMGMAHAGRDHAPGAGMMMMMTGPLPARLERHETMMTAHLDALHKVRTAVSSLYDTLTPDQKARADRHLCGGMGGHARGMAKGRHAHSHDTP
jgi:periplasmic protein CpxP/Spy